MNYLHLLALVSLLFSNLKLQAKSNFSSDEEYIDCYESVCNPNALINTHQDDNLDTQITLSPLPETESQKSEPTLPEKFNVRQELNRASIRIIKIGFQKNLITPDDVADIQQIIQHIVEIYPFIAESETLPDRVKRITDQLEARRDLLKGPILKNILNELKSLEPSENALAVTKLIYNHVSPLLYCIFNLATKALANELEIRRELNLAPFTLASEEKNDEIESVLLSVLNFRPFGAISHLLTVLQKKYPNDVAIIRYYKDYAAEITDNLFAWIIDQWFTQEELAHIVSWTTEDRTQYSLALTEKLSKLLKDREVIKELSEVQKKLCKRTYERAIIQAKTNPNELPIDDPLAFDESSDNLDD